MNAIKLSAFFFAVPALILTYGLIVLHRMSVREGEMEATTTKAFVDARHSPKFFTLTPLA